MAKPSKEILLKVRDSLSNLLFENAELLIIALSGGADSIALASLIIELKSYFGVEIHAVHVNHGLRGDESDSDESFVRDWCKKKNLNLTVLKTENILEIASEKKLSLEEAARQIRYDLISNEAKRLNTSAVLTAHTLDDDIETFLMRLFLGSSLKALSGIREKSEFKGITVIRPLLKIRKCEILEYLNSQNETWRDDSSNFQPDTLRNKIRLEIIPFMEKTLDRGVLVSVEKTLENIKRECSLLESLLCEIEISDTIWKNFSTCCRTGWLASVDDLKSAHPALRYRMIVRVLDMLEFEIKRRKSDIFRMIDHFLEIPGGQKSHHIGDSVFIERSSGAILISKYDQNTNEDLIESDKLKTHLEQTGVLKIEKSGVYEFNGRKITVETGIVSEISNEDVSSLEWTTCCLDVSLLVGGLEFIPCGLILQSDSGYEIDDEFRSQLKRNKNRIPLDMIVDNPVPVSDKRVLWIPGSGLSMKKKCQPKDNCLVVYIEYPDYMSVFLR